MENNLLHNEEQFNQFIKSNAYSLVHFSAKWCDTCEHLNNLLLELRDELNCFDFGIIEAEELTEISKAYRVDAAPTVLFFKNGTEIDRLKGFIPSELKIRIMKHNYVEGVASMVNKFVDGEKNDLEGKLKSLINQAPLMLFMKGTPESPKCGFSSQLVNLLRDIDADFSSFDVLTDEEVRQSLKEYSNWPTYPQLYLNGELIGGLDIVRKQLDDSEFCKNLPRKKDISERLKQLTTQTPLVLFMKGSPEAPQCKFSKRIVELLNSVNANYSFFDILKDEEVRQALKEYSNWPTYPQVYLNGELIGGLDVVTEELKNASFVEKLPKKI